MRGLVLLRDTSLHNTTSTLLAMIGPTDDTGFNELDSIDIFESFLVMCVLTKP